MLVATTAQVHDIIVWQGHDYQLVVVWWPLRLGRSLEGDIYSLTTRASMVDR
jgi:hypothetical protein